MILYQTNTSEGADLVIARKTRGVERYTFDSPEEAASRAKLLNYAETWIGTPFRDCADIVGPKGGVDCAMSLTRWHVDTGRLPPFEPRPYSARAMLHSEEELFLKWVQDRLGGVETTDPKPGDVLVWRYGKTFSHGGLLYNSDEVIHAYAYAKMCLVSPLSTAVLDLVGFRGATGKRPRKAFTVGRR